jgi:hypothetical protein
LLPDSRKDGFNLAFNTPDPQEPAAYIFPLGLKYSWALRRGIKTHPSDHAPSFCSFAAVIFIEKPPHVVLVRVNRTYFKHRAALLFVKKALLHYTVTGG